MKNIKVKAPYWEISADIYFPDNFDESKKYPAILSAHPIGSCKEQTSGNVYSEPLAKAGFVVIAFDASFQGDSTGEPRYIEDPTLRTEDFRLVIDYLVTQNYIDENRIGVLGICGGGGYSINVAMTERRIKAVGTVTGVNYGRVVRESTRGNSIKVLEEIALQRTAEARGDSLRVDRILYPTVEAARADHADIDLLEATEYYRTSRGEKPNGANKSLFSHNAVAFGWDAFHLAETLLTQPLMLIVGNKPGFFGAYRDGFEILNRAASKEKELVVLEGWSHYDLYDQPEPVSLALDKLIPFFQKHLK